MTCEANGINNGEIITYKKIFTEYRPNCLHILYCYVVAVSFFEKCNFFVSDNTQNHNYRMPFDRETTERRRTFRVSDCFFVFFSTPFFIFSLSVWVFSKFFDLSFCLWWENLGRKGCFTWSRWVDNRFEIISLKTNHLNMSPTIYSQ